MRSRPAGEPVAEKEAPKPELLLQWARIALYTGNHHIAEGASKFDPAFMRPAEEVLVAIKDEPSVAEDVWAHRFDIALSRDSAEEAERLLTEGEGKGFSPQTIGISGPRFCIAKARLSRWTRSTGILGFATTG